MAAQILSFWAYSHKFDGNRQRIMKHEVRRISLSDGEWTEGFGMKYQFLLSSE